MSNDIDSTNTLYIALCRCCAHRVVLCFAALPRLTWISSRSCDLARRLMIPRGAAGLCVSQLAWGLGSHRLCRERGPMRMGIPPFGLQAHWRAHVRGDLPRWRAVEPARHGS